MPKAKVAGPGRSKKGVTAQGKSFSGRQTAMPSGTQRARFHRLAWPCGGIARATASKSHLCRVCRVPRKISGVNPASRARARIVDGKNPPSASPPGFNFGIISGR